MPGVQSPGADVGFNLGLIGQDEHMHFTPPASNRNPQSPRQIVRAATRRAGLVSFYAVAPDGTATLESQVERPSRGLVRSRARAFFSRRG
jgi:hypothetical protein